MIQLHQTLCQLNFQLQLQFVCLSPLKGSYSRTVFFPGSDCYLSIAQRFFKAKREKKPQFSKHPFGTKIKRTSYAMEA